MMGHGRARQRHDRRGTPSARSPDGNWLVATTALGLVVTGSAQELWKLPEAPVDARHAQDCVIANDRTAVACVSDGKVVLLKRP